MVTIDGADESAVTQFRARLAELRLRIHQPTYAKIREYAAKGGDTLAESTVGNLLRGPGKPRWDTVRKFVLACGRYAERHAPDVPKSAFNLDHWLAAVTALGVDHVPTGYGTTDWGRRCAGLVAKWPLPPVNEVDPFSLRVFPSSRAMAYRGDARWPPYAGRDIDERLRHAIRRYPFVLLEGPSRSGKSRTAFEALAAAMPRRRLIVPVDRRSLIEIDRLEPPIYRDEAAVVLLDDVERFLNVEGDGLDLGILQRWERAGVTVLATVRFRERERLEQTLGSETHAVLMTARTFVLEYDLSTTEQRNARLLYPHERFPRGLAEHLAGADELRSVFDRGAESNPAGHAVVRSAADRRRSGLPEAVPKGALRRLFDVYYAIFRPADRPSDKAFAEGLRWALGMVGDVTALLVESRQTPDAYEVSDVIVDHLDSPERARAIPAAAWQQLLTMAEPAEMIAIGQAAVTRDELDIARQAFAAVVRDVDGERGHLAALQLGVLLQRQGDLEGAELAYRRAVRSSEVEVAPMAMINLAMLLDSRGEETEATALLLTVINSEIPAVFRTAARQNLARIRAIHGDEAGAAELIRAMVRGGDLESLLKMGLVALPSIAAREGAAGAQAFLTSLRDGAADVTEQITEQITQIMVSGFAAQPDYRGQIVSPEWLLRGSQAESPRGLFEVWRQSEEGDGGIWPVTTPEILTGLPPMAKIDVRTEATFLMGHIYEITGDPEQALRAYQQAWDDGLRKAALAIAKIKEGRGESAAAEDILNRLTRSEDLDVAAQALLRLGLLQHGAGRDDEAETTLHLAMDTQHSWVAAAAAATLGHVLLRRNAYRAARTPLEFAAYSDHEPAVIYGLIGLGAVELLDNDVPSARTAFRQAATLDQGNNGMIAALMVARTLTGQPEVLALINQTQDLVTSGRDPSAAAAGALQVGDMLGRAGELVAASRLLQWAAESGQPSALAATLRLGLVAWNGGLVDDAEQLFREAVAAEDEEISPQAAKLLEKLLADEAEQTQPPTSS